MAEKKQAAEAADPAPAAAKAGMVRLEVPGGITALGVEGQLFAVVDGVAEVPEALADAARRYLDPLWHKLQAQAKAATDAALAAAERERLPDFARDFLDRIEKLEREVFRR